jgi:preprotein translocase subunit SecG
VLVVVAVAVAVVVLGVVLLSSTRDVGAGFCASMSWLFLAERG